MAKQSIGALAGWKRSEVEHGVVLALQLVRSADAYRERDFDVVEVTMNDRQLRSLARDLIRAAHARGLDLHARPAWWRFWRRRRRR
ncbi:hypothetical protein [Sphingomonas lenta]|uniref:Uncharacterized protein n=1 Tax=Sphingomonas lenta TaxID=1141887 RepID=A0A2A2SAP9_9SPHN|nr:hypothetical protein [Sphingomonas lenta]PAX06326.1 hypothetical protein CKY28_17735 [Sphingomonas lenta]